MAQKRNTSGLIPIMQRTPEERREIARKGNRASITARRKKREFLNEFYKLIGYEKDKKRK